MCVYGAIGTIFVLFLFFFFVYRVWICQTNKFKTFVVCVFLSLYSGLTGKACAKRDALSRCLIRVFFSFDLLSMWQLKRPGFWWSEHKTLTNTPDYIDHTHTHCKTRERILHSHTKIVIIILVLNTSVVELFLYTHNQKTIFFTSAFLVRQSVCYPCSEHNKKTTALTYKNKTNILFYPTNIVYGVWVVFVQVAISECLTSLDEEDASDAQLLVIFTSIYSFLVTARKCTFL